MTQEHKLATKWSVTVILSDRPIFSLQKATDLRPDFSGFRETEKVSARFITRAQAVAYAIQWTLPNSRIETVQTILVYRAFRQSPSLISQISSQLHLI